MAGHDHGQVGADHIRSPENVGLVARKLEELRKRLIDLSRRNPLVDIKLGSRTGSFLRVIDELPDVLRHELVAGRAMRFLALPPLEAELPDERAAAFREALAFARRQDEAYIQAIEAIGDDAADAAEQAQKALRALKDRVRARLGLLPRQTRDGFDAAIHARLHGLAPEHELPRPEDERDERHEDDDIQTLLLPDRLARAARSLLEKGRSSERETGVNMLHAVFGLLEWQAPGERERFVSPLLLLGIHIERRQTAQGPEFLVRAVDEMVANTSLDLKLKAEHGLELPGYEGGDLEAWLEKIRKVEPPGWHWKVRREVAFGLFPFSKIAMYHDIDPSRRPIAEHATVALLLASTGSGKPGYREVYPTDDPEIATQVPHLVMDADASQYSALVDVARRENLAIEGPPGSGKSQTIVNLIAAALAAGRKVLFVAEKTTALDVVKSRLEAVGLGDFILPLQAGRGGADSVYQSIESRLKMDRRDGDLADSTSDRRAFEKARARLQRHLDALGADLGATGRSTHEVLGRAIATAGIRKALPPAVRRIPIADAEGMARHDVETLVAEVAAFAERLGQIADMPALWRAATVPVVRRDAAEELAAEAGDLAERMAAYAADIRASPIGALTADDPLAAEIEPLGRLLAMAMRSVGRVDPGLVLALVEPERRRAMRDLCGWIRERRALAAELRQLLRDPDAPDIDDWLETAAAFARRHGQRLDPARHREHLASIEQAIGAEQAILAAARALPRGWLESGKTLAEIQAGARRLADQPAELLRLRRAHPPGAIAALARELEQRLTELTTGLRRVRDVLPSADGSHEPAALRRAATTIEDAGFLARLTSSFKAARRLYGQELGGSWNGDQRSMAGGLRNYAAWIEARRKLDEAGRFRETFGSRFQGYDTDPAAIRHVVAFHALCSEIAAGDGDLDRFFQAGDLTPVLAFAAAATVPALTLAELERGCRARGEEALRVQNELAACEALLDRFRDRAALPLAAIEDIRRRKAAETDLARRIETSPARTSIGAPLPGVELLDLAADLAAAIAASGRTDLLGEALRDGRIAAMAAACEAFAARRRAIEDRCAAFATDLGLPAGLDRAAGLSGRLEDLRRAAADPVALLSRPLIKAAEDRLRGQGLGDLLDWAIGEGRGFDQASLGPIAEALVAHAMADAALQRHGNALLGYDGQQLDRLRREIADRDRSVIEGSRRAIARGLLATARPPGGNHIGARSSFTELALIRHELGKKRRRIAIRDLTRRAGRALLELKPCWMMSPLAVAQYLHDGTGFDLVVIDEASQMTPENAIGAISRAGQAVVVGDTKQLPPTRFFQKMLDEDEIDEDVREDSESILDMANVAFGSVRQLRWHYRSRHPDLIQFSNRWMYQNQLTIFPAAQARHPDLGVRLQPVDGVYQGRRNPIEAGAVIAAAIRHMSERPDLSLGICTMNGDQRDLLLDELEKERDRNPKVRAFVESWEKRNDGLEEFFIKSIETIQGDERDVMLISTLYGPETPGARVHQRFGPINSAQGDRRLNVLFTRAKRKIVTFTSIKPTDILVEGARNRGVPMFRDWLDYSATGHVGGPEEPRGTHESPFEAHVGEEIARLGYVVEPQVGVAGYRIDLGIRHPDRPYGYILGIECDGAAYHGSRSSRDRDRLRQEILEGLGWRLYRIWSTDWYRDPQRQLQLLREVLAAAKADAAADPPAPVIPPPPVETVVVPQAAPAQIHLPIDLPLPGDLFPDAPGRAAEPMVRLGSRVRVENITNGGRKLAFTLVEGMNDPDAGRVAIHTPLGRALLDAQIGDTVEYLAGSHVREVRVLEIG